MCEAMAKSEAIRDEELGREGEDATFARHEFVRLGTTWAECVRGMYRVVNSAASK